MKTIPRDDSASADDSAITSGTSSTDEERQAALNRLSRQAFENGLYDRNEMPEGGNDE